MVLMRLSYSDCGRPEGQSCYSIRNDPEREGDSNKACECWVRYFAIFKRVAKRETTFIACMGNIETGVGHTCSERGSGPRVTGRQSTGSPRHSAWGTFRCVFLGLGIQEILMKVGEAEEDLDERQLSIIACRQIPSH